MVADGETGAGVHDGEVADDDATGTEGAEAPAEATASTESAPPDEAPAAPPPRDHYVVATTKDGREVPIWDSHHDRQEFSREEAEEVQARYTHRMAADAHLITYEVRGIEAHHLKTSPPPPPTVEPTEPASVRAEVAFADGAVDDRAAFSDEDLDVAVPLAPVARATEE